MSSSKEFKQAIREGRLNDALAIVMGNAPELHISTAIADTSDNSLSSQGKYLHTHVNLVQGKITNEIDESLIEDNLYSSIQEFHIQQVAQGHQIINQNLQSIQQIFRLLTILQQQQQGESAYTPINTWRISNTTLPPASVPPSYESNSIDETVLLASQSDELQSIDDDDMVDELLSLDDIEIEQTPQQEDTELTKKDEDWGDWLDEDNNDSDTNVIGLDDIEIEQSEDWQSEDWEDDTEFIINDEQNK